MGLSYDSPKDYDSKTRQTGVEVPRRVHGVRPFTKNSSFNAEKEKEDNEARKADGHVLTSGSGRRAARCQNR